MSAGEERSAASKFRRAYKWLLGCGGSRRRRKAAAVTTSVTTGTANSTIEVKLDA